MTEDDLAFRLDPDPTLFRIDAPTFPAEGEDADGLALLVVDVDAPKGSGAELVVSVDEVPEKPPPKTLALNLSIRSRPRSVMLALRPDPGFSIAPPAEKLRRGCLGV